MSIEGYLKLIGFSHLFFPKESRVYAAVVSGLIKKLLKSFPEAEQVVIKFYGEQG